MNKFPAERVSVSGDVKVMSILRKVLIGAALGFLLAWRPGAFLLLTATLLTCGLIRRFVDEEDRRFIVCIFIFSLGARILLATLNQYFWIETVPDPLLGPDGERYSTGGWYISQIISGTRFERLFSEEFHRAFPNAIKFLDYVDFIFRFHGKFLPALSHHAIGYFSYAIAFLYSMIGYSPLILKWLNGFLGSLLPLLAYGLGRAMFDGRAVGRIAAVLLALHPSLMIWSATALKDPVIIGSALFFLYALIRFLAGGWIWSLGVLAGGMGMMLFRPWTGFIVWGTLSLGALGWAVARFWRFTRWIAAGTGIALLVLLVYQFPAAKNLSTAVVFQWKNSYAGRFQNPGPSSYLIFPKSAYGETRIGRIVARPLSSKELLHGLAFSIANFLFLPYPCCAEGGVLALSSVVFLFWNVLLVFGLLGYLQSWRENPIDAWFLGLFGVSASLAIALNSFVVGTLIRHRDLVTPLFLVWAAGGLGWVAPKVRRWIVEGARGKPTESIPVEGSSF